MIRSWILINGAKVGGLKDDMGYIVRTADDCPFSIRHHLGCRTQTVAAGTGLSDVPDRPSPVADRRLLVWCSFFVLWNGCNGDDPPPH
jgi:hypothetical protein